MFRSFAAKNANELWLQVAGAFVDREGEWQPGRRLATQEMLHVALSLSDPRQRWVFARTPALNPAFALAEVIWILSGSQDAEFLNFWNRQLRKFAGDQPKYHGAYGHRLRRHFGFDQLARAAAALRANPDGRQVVLQIWDPSIDMPSETGTPVAADIPCNVMSILKCRSGSLEWLQILRSNDFFLGLPHNLVQFTTLHEVLAGWIGVEVGEYLQLSDSLHVYEDHWGQIQTSVKRGASEIGRNNDSLSLTQPLSEMVFTTLDRSARLLASGTLNQGQTRTLVGRLDIPKAYQNWMLVLAAEASRRRGWVQLAVELMLGCTNEALSYSWELWLDRLTANRPEAAAVGV
jgi:thymidylate synthase